MTPSILLTATLRWPIAARLAIAFTNMGCHVEAMCPHQHPVTKTRAIRRIYSYSALNPLASLRQAIASAQPDIVIPCDDNAALNLSRLYEYARATESSASSLVSLIARSLGSPPACALAAARGELMDLATEEGVRVPANAVITTPNELMAWLAQHGFPAVIKIDSTWGGLGVTIVHNDEQARRVFARMAARPPMKTAITRTLLERDPSFFLNFLKQSKRTVSVQNFISGIPANRAVACWQGEILEGISVEAIKTQHPTGPATVVRVIENSEMSLAAAKLVRRLGLSGLWGLDFVLAAQTGAAYFIEMNPRATPICHLPLSAGRNLPAALYAKLTGVSPLAAPLAIEHDVIALFPGEWQRDPASSYLRSDYHDIPWEEPALIQDCIDKPWAERGLVARGWARMRPKSAIKAAMRQKNRSDFQLMAERVRENESLAKFKQIGESGEATKLAG